MKSESTSRTNRSRGVRTVEVFSAWCVKYKVILYMGKKSVRKPEAHQSIPAIFAKPFPMHSRPTCASEYISLRDISRSQIYTRSIQTVKLCPAYSLLHKRNHDIRISYHSPHYIHHRRANITVSKIPVHPFLTITSYYTTMLERSS
jgi:hypothetical protein